MDVPGFMGWKACQKQDWGWVINDANSRESCSNSLPWGKMSDITISYHVNHCLPDGQYQGLIIFSWWFMSTGISEISVQVFAYYKIRFCPKSASHRGCTLWPVVISGLFPRPYGFVKNCLSWFRLPNWGFESPPCSAPNDQFNPLNPSCEWFVNNNPM